MSQYHGEHTVEVPMIRSKITDEHPSGAMPSEANGQRK